MQQPPPPPRQNPPKDGYGPRGFPDCYYTSRVLNSTFRYVRYIKKLRALEEEQRRGAVNTLKALKDKQYNDFFIRCDRRSLIKNVGRRVDLCMASYQEDLKDKRQRLIDLLSAEEEQNIRKFVEQAQAGVEALWQDKQNRLAYLLAKRKKEHEEKYKDTPLSKCVHVLPCIFKKRAKEASDFQLYQIREKQMRKIAEKEFDKMWHELAMKESEALAARMELDVIERARQMEECKRFTDYQLEMRRQEKEREREMLKQEALNLNAQLEEYARKEEEAKRQQQLKRDETARERKDTIRQRKEMLAKQAAELQLINDTWDSLAGMGLADEKAKEEKRRQKEKELDLCNMKMEALKIRRQEMEAADDALLKQEQQRLQDKVDKRRCEYALKSKKTNDETRAGIVEQIKANELAQAQRHKQYDDEIEYRRQLDRQIDQLVAEKALTEAQAKKLYRKQLLEQIEYGKVLKERALKEEQEQKKKCELAAEEYQQEINRMLCRPFFSEDIHPFMKPMYRGLKMRETCPCSKPDYCAAEPSNSKEKQEAAIQDVKDAI